MSRNHAGAFSLVEITVAIGVIAFALVAILGLLPIGMKSGREAIDATRTSLIAQDVCDRVHASMVSNDQFSQFYFGPYSKNPPLASFFFYTSDGARTSPGARTGELLKVQFPNDQPAFYPNVKKPSDFYRAKVIVDTFDQSVSYNSYDPREVSSGKPDLLCATVEVRWPVNTQDGSITGSSNNKATYTFFLRKP
jgi:hypothetical protein